MATAKHFYMKNAEGEWEELIDLVIPESVKKIKDYAFAGFSSIQTLAVHKNIKSFGTSAFEDCKSLKTVYYYGTVKDWKSKELNKVLDTKSIKEFYVLKDDEWVNDYDTLTSE